MITSTVTLLSHYGPTLINGTSLVSDEEFQEFEKITHYIDGIGYCVSMGDEFFGCCEATGKRGTVAEFKFITN